VKNKVTKLPIHMVMGQRYKLPDNFIISATTGPQYYWPGGLWKPG